MVWYNIFRKKEKVMEEENQYKVTEKDRDSLYKLEQDEKYRKRWCSRLYPASGHIFPLMSERAKVIISNQEDAFKLTKAARWARRHGGTSKPFRLSEESESRLIKLAKESGFSSYFE